MKEKKKVQTENQERIKTPFSEMVRKFKKTEKCSSCALFYHFSHFPCVFRKQNCAVRNQ